MARPIGAIRRSQLITTYGVGAIVAVGDESFMVAGIHRWSSEVDLHEPRLERLLRVKGFVRPPVTKNEKVGDIPVVRFPQWVYCRTCHLLAEHRHFTGVFDNKCSQCSVSLIASRYVACCPKGHIEDFPYFNWVHAGNTGPPCPSGSELRIEMKGNTASLGSTEISCSCGAKRTMEGAFAKNALRGIKSCGSARPWLSRPDVERCEETLRTLQRGASNVWFSVTPSSVSIPPWSELAYKVINRHWIFLEHVPDEALPKTIKGARLTEGTPYSTDDLVFAVRQRRDASTEESVTSVDDLKNEEYEALCRGAAETSKDQDFVCVHAPEPLPSDGRWFDQVMEVRRLRMVRALSTFSRVRPPAHGLSHDEGPPLYDGEPLGWLPGIEVIGEGVFLRVAQQALLDWETQDSVRQRVKVIHDHYLSRCERDKAEANRVIRPRFVLIHTLAHVLIGQWSLDAGYPASSLRERLFVSDTMCGLLIYTATSDSAGSLGGVVAQADPRALEDAVGEAVQTASWCSSDPLCAEADAAGVDSLNLAACHACVLLPEVSCEEMNLFLDRALLVGTTEEPEVGFFRELVE